MFLNNRLCATCFCAFFLLSFQADAAPLQRVEERLFGRTPEGEEVQLFTLRNAHGLTMRVMGRGATITELRTPEGISSTAGVAGSRKKFGAEKSCLSSRAPPPSVSACAVRTEKRDSPARSR